MEEVDDGETIATTIPGFQDSSSRIISRGGENGSYLCAVAGGIYV